MTSHHTCFCSTHAHAPVDGDVQNVGVVPEHLLDAIAMVDVPVLMPAAGDGAAPAAASAAATKHKGKVGGVSSKNSMYGGYSSDVASSKENEEAAARAKKVETWLASHGYKDKPVCHLSKNALLASHLLAGQGDETYTSEGALAHMM